MKGSCSCQWLASTLTTLLVFSNTPGYAATFGQQEINQSQVVAIARPYGSNQYDLLILQQIPGKRQCWQEQEGTPTLINPLLLNFDFTGSCERSTDSNGYSIRLNGKDLGLTYLLRVVERNGELLLVGTSRQDAGQSELIIGRTQGLSPGFMKIQLDPGWRFTKRTYGGKMLSHVYLTGDFSTLPVNKAVSSPSNPAMIPSPIPPVNPAIQQAPAQEFIFTAPSNAPNNPSLRPQSRNLMPQGQPVATLPTAIASPLSPRQPLTAPPSNLSQVKMVAPLTPTLTANSGNLLPPPPSSPKPIPTSGWGMIDEGNTPANNTPANNTPAFNPSFSNQRSSVVTPPAYSSSISSSSVGNSQGFRVLAAASNPMQQEQVRSLYPEAFNTTYNGQRLLQIGRFSSRENAEQASQSLAGVGLRAIIVP